LKYW